MTATDAAGVRGALAVWAARAPRALGDLAYLVYIVALSALILLGPGVRAAWLLATGADGRAVLTDQAVPSTWAAATALVWLAALVVGRERGPALRPPFPAAVLGDAGVPRTRSFGGPVLRATLALVVAGALVPAIPVAALVDLGAATPRGAGLVVAVGAVAGLVTAGAWLAGQVIGARTFAVVAGVLAAGAALAVAGAWTWAPWALVGTAWHSAAWPGAGAHVGGIVAGVVLALGMVAPLRAGLERLATRRIVGQAVRAQRAQALVDAMDLQASGEVYRALPSVGRRLAAVGHVRGPAAVVVADVVGSLRTPARLLGGVVALVLAGAVVGAELSGTTLAVGPVLAAILAYAGVSVLCDGLRHAAALGEGSAQYGLSRPALRGLHAVWPTVAGIGLAGAGAALAGAPAGLATAVVGVVVAVRLADVLKGVMPVEMLVPIVTPMGDLSAAGRAVWLADGPLLVLAAGVAGAFAADGRGGLGLVAALVAAVLGWRALRR